MSLDIDDVLQCDQCMKVTEVLLECRCGSLNCRKCIDDCYCCNSAEGDDCSEFEPEDEESDEVIDA